MEPGNFLLPDDVLHELFKYLDGKSLKEAALVCKNWNDVIESSSATMNHFRLNINTKDIEENFSDIMSLQRKFKEMELEIGVDNYKSVKDISFYHGMKVIKLKISPAKSNVLQMGVTSALVEYGESFPNILSNFPNLEELKIDAIRIFGNFTVIPKAQLNKLKKLQISTQYDHALQTIYAPKLKSLSFISIISSTFWLIAFLETCPCLETLIFRKCYDYFQVFESSTIWPFNLKVFEATNDENACMNGFENFLQKFSNLESVTTSNGMIGGVLYPNPENVQFRLKKLECSLWSPYIDQIIDDSYIAFLRTQVQSLTEIKSVMLFCGSVELDAEYEQYFTRMKFLEKLTFGRKNPFPKDQQFYDELSEIQNVKELRFVNLDIWNQWNIEFQSKQEIFLRGILPKLPNLELFEAFDPVDDFPNLLSYLATNNPKISTLSLWTLEDHEPGVNFQYLKKLNLSYIKNVETFQAFVRNHPTIETLQVEKIRDAQITDKVVNDLLQKL